MPSPQTTIEPYSPATARRGRSPQTAPRARVVRCVKEWMADGTLLPGQPLPSEREIAARTGVNRETVRLALKMLDDEGLIRSNGGRLRIVNGSTAIAARSSTLMEHAIAVLTGHNETPQHEQSGWLEYITEGALKSIRQAGWHGLGLHPARLTGTEVSRLLADPPAGVIVTDFAVESGEIRQTLAALRAAKAEVVVYGDWPIYADFDRVSSDHEAGAYAVTRHLLQSGRRRILQLAVQPATGYWYAARRAGYERALREAGIAPLPLLAVPPFPLGDRDVFLNGVRHLAGYLVEFLSGSEPVDAITAATDADIFGVAAACRLFGLEPNAQVAIAGYDDYWQEWPLREFEPIAPCVTVNKNNSHIGAALVELALDRLEGRLSDAAPQRRVVEPRLVVTN